MKVWMLFILIFTSPVVFAEFNFIKLKPEFEEFLEKQESKPKTSSKTLMKSGQPAMATIMKNALLNSSSSTLGNRSKMNSPIPVDGEDSALYEQIRSELESSHSQIGLEQIQSIHKFNQQFNLGSSNFSGFSWQKPIGVVQIYADRQVTPNLFGTDWLVMDTFTFEISATTFLEKLSEAGLSTMSSAEIGAFAGITFKRIYTTWHYANSYQAGLQADFSKLFLPFLKFNKRGMEHMTDGEVIKREDIWTAKAGGLISTPPLYNLTFSAGVLAKQDFHSLTSVQSTNSPLERFKLTVSSKKKTTVGATAELQLDFFKLIKLSLLRYDMNYEYSSEKEFTINLNGAQWAQLKEETPEGQELKSILRGFGTIKKLEPYVVRLDESSDSSLEQRGSILIWGRMQKQKTEQIRVIQNNQVRVFYKNYSQNIKVVQNILSRLFSAIVYKILKFPMGAKNAAVYSRQITMEYEATHPQSNDPKILRIDKSEQFSFVLTQYYNASRTDRFIDNKFKNDVIWFVRNFTTLPKSYQGDIKSEILKGPINVESNLRVENAGFKYLLDSSIDIVFGHIAKVCQSQRKTEWINASMRREILKEELAEEELCVKELGFSFANFKNDYLLNHLKPSLAKFKSFITKYYKKSESIMDLQVLFGIDNTFINGKLTAQTSVGMSFDTNFSTGQFRGLGVIDNTKRENGSRSPASIVSDDL